MPWSEAAEWQKQSARNGVLKIATGEVSSPESIHQSWSESKTRDGWTYGLVKDAMAKTHPCLVAWIDLPVGERIKDPLFFAVAHTMLYAHALVAPSGTRYGRGLTHRRVCVSIPSMGTDRTLSLNSLIPTPKTGGDWSQSAHRMFGGAYGSEPCSERLMLRI